PVSITAMLFSLPDVIWRELLERLTIEDQLRLNRVCRQGAEKMRHLNSGVTTMVISTSVIQEEVERLVNNLSLASTPSMQLALSAGGDQFEPFADYPLTTAPPSQWAYLELFQSQLLDTGTIESIVDTFSAVTDLKFFGEGNICCKNFTALLQHPQWRHQLTNLMIYWPNYDRFSIDQTNFSKMLTAVNSLPAIKTLVMNWCRESQLPLPLTILAKLDTVLLINKYISSCSPFLVSLQSHAAKNENLKIIFSPYKIIEWKINLDNALSQQLIRFFPTNYLSLEENLHDLCHQFSSLTSISVKIEQMPEIGPVFTALAQLPRLVHLKVNFFARFYNQKHQTVSLESLLKPLISVRALDLYFSISVHSQLNWLNLTQTLPNLQAIHVYNFFCQHCNVSHKNHFDSGARRYTKYTTPNMATAIQCLRATLGQLHSNFQSQPCSSHSLIVCRQGAEKMRHLNSGVTTMVIYNWSTPEEVEIKVNELSLATTPSIQLAISAGGDKIEPFDDYPKTTVHPSKWAYLKITADQLLDLQTIESIINTFSAVTDLKFFGEGNASCKNLTFLLEQYKWPHQLTNLMMYWPTNRYLSDDRTIVSRLIRAVNGLSKLRFLAMRWLAKSKLPVELSILSQLEVVSFDTCCSAIGSKCFLPFSNRHAAKNDKLKSLVIQLCSEILEKLTFEDKLGLNRVCIEGAEKMQHLTSGVTTMVISTWASQREIENAVNELSLASAPSMQLALAAGGDQIEPFADYPLTTAHPSECIFLSLPPFHLLDSNIIESIVDTFSAVTDLKFFGDGNDYCKSLTALLKHPKWRHQLTNLMIHWFYD
ncbi:hypothetical protein TYRP_022706, partial [Tyrophagus putrescentiae]